MKRPVDVKAFLCFSPFFDRACGNVGIRSGDFHISTRCVPAMERRYPARPACDRLRRAHEIRHPSIRARTTAGGVAHDVRCESGRCNNLKHGGRGRHSQTRASAPSLGRRRDDSGVRHAEGAPAAKRRPVTPDGKQDPDQSTRQGDDGDATASSRGAGLGPLAQRPRRGRPAAPHGPTGLNEPRRGARWGHSW